MKFDVRVEATTNEKRRFFGQADVTPMVELASVAMDKAMLAVVEARSKALSAEIAANQELDPR
ncbi:MAG: DUF6489 family protein [Pseudomonadota bacterium]